jgi:hypothetical protein
MKVVVRDCVTYKFLGAERSVRVTAPLIRGAAFVTFQWLPGCSRLTAESRCTANPCTVQVVAINQTVAVPAGVWLVHSKYFFCVFSPPSLLNTISVLRIFHLQAQAGVEWGECNWFPCLLMCECEWRNLIRPLQWKHNIWPHPDLRT